MTVSTSIHLAAKAALAAFAVNSLILCNLIFLPSCAYLDEDSRRNALGGDPEPFGCFKLVSINCPEHQFSCRLTPCVSAYGVYICPNGEALQQTSASYFKATQVSLNEQGMDSFSSDSHKCSEIIRCFVQPCRLDQMLDAWFCDEDPEYSGAYMRIKNALQGNPCQG